MADDPKPGKPSVPAGPSVRTIDLAVEVAPYVSGLQTALSRPPRIQFAPVEWQEDAPGVISVDARARPPAVRSFVFSQPETPIPLPPPQRRRASKTVSRRGETRIAPPKDLVKLEDRLLYTLQPSLESLFSGGALGLPFQPFPYQLQGVAFLYPRYAAVLADEMGLGKTMQAITATRLLLHAGQLRRVLLVCPKPLVTNWQREFSLWAPEIPLNVIQGNQTTRHWQWRLPEAVVSIANYELLVRDREIVSDGQVPFDLVILDESQRVKNRNGTTSQVVRSLSRRRSWALTGTPVENSTDDLVGIFEFVSPGVLTPHMRPRRMASAVRDYVLRRRKDQVLHDLPPKLIRDAELGLTDAQRETYEGVENEGVMHLSQLGQSVTVHHVFELILRLKQICNFDPVTGQSAKLDRLEADLDEVAASGQKAIIFSQYVATLEQLAEHLVRFGPVQYHGKVPSRQRDARIAQFRDDPNSNVILMSYGAGSVGLNLQFASYVFLFDRWWNPAVEDQAINRAHRIGVAGPVTVTRFLSLQTIEERINQVLEQKRELFDTIFTGEQGPRNVGLSQDEIFGLFDLRGPQGPLKGAA